MTTRGFFTVLGMTAIACAAYLAFMPTYTEVSTSVLPDALLESVEFSVGGPIGISIDPGSATARFDCGSMVSPAEVQFSNSNGVWDFFGQAERVESRVKSGCDQTHDRRWQLVVVTLIGAGMLLGFAVVSGRRPSSSQSLAPSAPPFSPSSALPIPPHAAPNGPPIAPRRGDPPPTSPPTSPPIAVPASDEDSATAAGPLRRKQVVGATVAGLAVLTLVGAAAGIDRGVARIGVPGLPAATIDPALDTARQCVTAAFDSIDSAYDRARDSSVEDRDASSINLDGDASWQRYSDALRGLDVDGCSIEFRTTVVELANAWGAFGDDWLASTKGLSFDRLSDDDRQRHATRVNAARQLLEDLASEIDLEVRHVTYTLG